MGKLGGLIKTQLVKNKKKRKPDPRVWIFSSTDNSHYNYILEDGKINLYYAMDLLENRLKNTIILRYFYNMSYKEIGDILDLNESTVKLYIRKSLKLMALDLEENFQNEK